METYDMTERVTYEQDDRVAWIVMDDGKANVMSVAMLSALHAAFDRAARTRSVVVLKGRGGVFSAGFDLKTLMGGTAGDFFSMLRLGAELALKILAFPTPVVTVTEGHAYPMGAFLMLAADWRIGTEGAWKVGLNEVQIGIPVPRFAIEVARQRLAPAWLSRTTVTGEMYGPDEARLAGFIDELVPGAELNACVDAAVARMLSADPSSHALTKQRLRAPAIAAMRVMIDEDITMDYASHVMSLRAA
jgi:enoyl-CoA hydratase